MSFRIVPLFALLFALFSASVHAGDGNRFAYLDNPIDPYYPSARFPKLTTPMWMGEEGVEAAIVLAIDDMRGVERWEQYLRPILERLKRIDGRAPVSIMTCTIDPAEPHLQKWLQEGLSLEVHTIDHPCPLLQGGDFKKAKSTYERCVALLGSVPNNEPVAYRMPCCDSLNTVSPRFFAEIFRGGQSPVRDAASKEPLPAAGRSLQVDSSVFNFFTANDPDLPRELVVDADGRDRFLKYLPAGRSFVNTIENYPYPYVIGGNCWEFPCATPSDWQGQNLNKPNSPTTVADLKAAIDATVLKQGVFNFVFHPHGWIESQQVIELIDHVVDRYGGRVKFLTFRDALARLNLNLLNGSTLRSVPADGGAANDHGVRLLDVNADGWLDAVFAHPPQRPAGGEPDQLRLWQPGLKRWQKVRMPPAFHAKFGVLTADGVASMIAHASDSGVANPPHLAVHRLNGDHWVSERSKPIALPPSLRRPAVRLADYWLRDADGNGICELIAEFTEGKPEEAAASSPLWHALYSWDSEQRDWLLVPDALVPNGDAKLNEGFGRAMRLIDLDEDGRDDLVISGPRGSSIHLFDSLATGWRRTVTSPAADGRHRLPPFIRADGTDNGSWVHSRHLWWQNEDTAGLKDLVDRRSFAELLDTGMPEAKSPEVSLQCIKTRPGFNVELVAAEPLVADPIAFAWGADGKFWVVEMGDYPLGSDGRGKPGGRVRFLEDTNGDGAYDRSTVFLDELPFPTGVMPWRGGVLVTCAPDILYAEDSDGDGKADVKRAVYSGFVPGNQQHRVNGLSWGLDGWIYGANGDSGGSIRSDQRDAVNIGGRDFRIRPDEGWIEPATGQTQFGRPRDDWGIWFGCNNSNPMFQFVLPDHYLRRNPHIAPPDPRVNVSAVPGASPVYPVSKTLERFNDPNTANRFTSACSAIVYRDNLFGAEFEGNSFVCEPVHNLIHREVMSRGEGRGGSSGDDRLPTEPIGLRYSSRRAADEQRSEFLASSDNWFRPTMVQTGPDGALWIADMYRLVIEHPEWIPREFQERLDLRAGHDKGRIYRVLPAGKERRPIPRLDRMNTAELVAALDSSNGWQRDMVHMLLLWRGDKEAVPALERQARTAERAVTRLHALCVLDGLSALKGDNLEHALSDGHSGVRSNAVRIAEPRLDNDSSLVRKVMSLAGDDDLQVRLQVAFSLGECSDRLAGRKLGEIARDNSDPFILAAVASSATRHALEILEVLLPRGGPTGGDRQPPPALIESLIGQLVAQKDFKAIARAIDLIVPGASDARLQAWQMNTVASLFDAMAGAGDQGAEVNESVAVWQGRLESVVAGARNRVLDQEAALSDRLAALRLLGRDRSSMVIDLETLAGLIAPQTSGELQEAAISAAARIQHADTPQKLIDSWPESGPRVRSAILDTLIAREPWIAMLLDRLEQGVIHKAEIDAVHRQRMMDHKTDAVRDRAAKLFGQASDSSKRALLDMYRAAAPLDGDRQRGAMIFQKSCAGCHRVGTVGHELGPDLSSMANRSADFFLAAILDPNQAVETRYVSYLAATRGGRLVTGMLATEAGNSITLAAQDGKRETLLRSELESLQSTGKSLMPEGLEQDVSPAAMADLLAFLRASGPPRKSFEGNSPELVKPELLRRELYLLATSCEIYGRSLVFEDKYNNLGFWAGEDDHAVWNFQVDRPGKYAVILDYACDDSTAGNRFVLETGSQRLTGTVPGTGNWDTYKPLRIGTLTLDPGDHRLVFRSAGPLAGYLLDLRGIRITPERK